MNNEKIDLTNCDREPIHIPGSIQPHGVVLAIAEPSLKILQVSENAAELFGCAAADLLDETLEKLLAPEDVEYLKSQILPKNLEASPRYLPTFRIGSEKREFEVIVHRYEGLLILELEENSISSAVPLEIYASLKSTLSQLEEASNVKEFCRRAAEEVRAFTNFDRVMIYRFAGDASGEVFAESKRDDLEAFLGMHYPAADIPQQARALYIKSWLRFKVDNEAAPVALVPQINPQTGKPLDMSYAVLRSMSPVHTEYLRNMGVRSTMSISIIKDGELWGLVACHHYAAPRYVAHDARMACELLAHFLSLQMSAKEAMEDGEYTLRLNTRHAELVEIMLESEDFAQGLMKEESRFLNWIDADGVALVTGDEINLLGKTPNAEIVRKITGCLTEQVADEIFATDNLADICADAADCKEYAAGLLAMRLSIYAPTYLLWFRPEISQRVNWAGEPTKLTESSEFGERLTPRKSFDLWVEQVGGKSAPWKNCELEASANLRRSIMEIVVRKAEALAKLNAELEHSNIELDSFAYIASHDLKEPLRGIHNFSHFLIEGYADKLEADGQEKLQTLMRLTQRMESLIESLLQYSRIGRTQLTVSEVNLNNLLGETLEMMQTRISETDVEIRLGKNLPTVSGDEVLLREVFTNLITNAVKYNDKPKRWVEVGFVEGEMPTFFVRDNGIGIPEKNYESIFRIFKRLHGREAFGGGVGAGLTITKKIVERHGGQIRIESVPQEGTTFYFTLNMEAQTGKSANEA